MARKSRGTNPYTKVMSSKVGPVVPYRNNLLTAVSGTVVTEEVDFNLQQHNEVMDIMRIEAFWDPTAYDSTVADGNCDIELGAYSNPGNTGASLASNTLFETDPEMIWYAHETWNHELMTAVGTELRKTASHHARDYSEPFTVARNILLAVVMTQTTAIFTGAAINARFLVWARRRICSDAEWRDIVDRERY